MRTLVDRREGDQPAVSCNQYCYQAVQLLLLLSPPPTGTITRRVHLHISVATIFLAGMRFFLLLALLLSGTLLPQVPHYNPSSFLVVSALNAALYVTPHSPDSSPVPQNCDPDNSTGQCNLRSAISACNSYLTDSTSWCSITLPPGDVILLDPYLGDLQIVTAVGALEITGNNATISPLPNGTTPFRFLTMAQLNLDYLSANISNISFHNFSSNGAGGVLKFQNLDFISLHSLTFLNNSALSGGAISLDGCADIQISSCSFGLNSAEDGGAIQFETNNRNILVTLSHFFDNLAASPSSSDRNQGGAIYFNSLNSLIEISHCFFNANEGVNGGAVYFHSENQLVLITNCRYERNRASFGGGVMLYNRNSEVTVKDTLLDSNTALQFYGRLHSHDRHLTSSLCRGAAFTLYSSHEVTLLHDCTFRYNSASGEAGGVYVVSINEDIEVYNCEFLSNEAGTNGGAFAFVNGNTNITFLRSSFLSNRAGKAGGAIYSALATTQWTAVSCVFQDNRAVTYGGALSVANDNEYFTLRTCDLLRNQASIGGAIYFGNTNNFIAITSSNISDNQASSYGGGIVSLCANFAIYSSVLLRNSAVESGGIHIDEGTNTIISRVTFDQNVAQTGRGGGSTIIGNGDVLVVNSRYLRNTAGTNGGAIYLSSSHVLFFNNSFDSNQATGSGGSMYSTAISTLVVTGNEFMRSVAVDDGGAVSVTQVTEFILNSSSFIGNTCIGSLSRGSALYLASSTSTVNDNLFQSNAVPNGPGTIFWTYSTMSEPTALSTNTFLSNSAIYGAEVATEGYALAMADQVNVTEYGSSPISPFSVSIVDFYQQTVRTDSSSIVDFSLQSSNNPSCYNGAAYLTGGVIGNYRSGVAIVGQLEAHCSPGESLTAVASTSLPEISSEIFIEFQIQFRECYSGEINVQGDCQSCSEFYYSFDPSTDTQCRACPENAVCAGGNRLNVQRGYWRQCQDCHVVEPCRLTDVCLGGENVSTQCREGHSGPLCNLCEEGYAMGADFKCAQCTSTSSTIPLIVGPVLLFLLTLIIITAYLKRDLLLTTLENLANSIKNTIRKYQLGSFQTKIKILISFAQILTSLPVMFDVDYPMVFRRFLDSISFTNLNFLNIFSVGCVWKSNFYDSLLLYTIGPALIMATLATILHLRMLLALRINEKMPSYSLQDRNEHIKLMCIFIAFLVFSPSSVRIFQTFVCEEFEDGTVTLVADSSLSCQTDQWKYFVTYASVMCVVYPLGIPLFYLYSLSTSLSSINPADLQVIVASEIHLLSPEIIQKEKIKYRQAIPRIRGLSFLFASYLPRNWYFEVIECFRRLMLTSIPLLFLRSKSLQIVLVLLLSLTFCAVYQELRPFVNQSDNVVAIYSQWAITLTVLGSLCLRVDMTDEINSFGPDAIGVLMTILNIFVGFLTLIAAIRTDGLNGVASPSEQQKGQQQEGEGEEQFPAFSSRRPASSSQNRRFSEMTWGGAGRGGMKRAGGLAEGGDSDDDDSDDDGERHSSPSRNPMVASRGGGRERQEGAGTGDGRTFIRGVELTEL